MIPEYVQRIKDRPVPKSGKEVATFLGFAGYYRTFIPQYSALTNRLNRIKKAEKFLWNEEIEQDFMELKKAFMVVRYIQGRSICVYFERTIVQYVFPLLDALNHC